MVKSTEEIFSEACRLGPDLQGEFLDRTCERNSHLRAELEALLKADKKSVPLLDGNEVLKMVVAREPEPGDLIDRYKLVKRIGAGGMGLVFLAEQNQPVRRQVAVKVIQNGGICSENVLRRFSSERQVLAMLDHPNVTTVLDGGITDSGLPFFVMEFVNGVPITTFCDQQRLPLTQRLRLFADTCRAFEHAHQKGIIHRDIKPSNILVCYDNESATPKVIDFGIAKALEDPLATNDIAKTRIGSLLGTPQYMSPEQAKMDATSVDVRTDVYSLGVLLYELLTGSTPLDEKEIGELGLLKTFEMIRDCETEPPSARAAFSTTQNGTNNTCGLPSQKYSRLLKGDLDWIVLNALARDASQRYDSVKSLRQDIENFLDGNPVSVAAPSPFYRARKFLKKHWIPCFSSAIVVCILFSATIFSSWQLIRAKHAKANSDFLARQLNAKSVRLTDALSRAKSGESFKQRLLRNKKNEAAIERAFGKFMHFHMLTAERDFQAMIRDIQNRDDVGAPPFESPLWNAPPYPTSSKHPDHSFATNSLDPLWLHANRFPIPALLNVFSSIVCNSSLTRICCEIFSPPFHSIGGVPAVLLEAGFQPNFDSPFPIDASPIPIPPLSLLPGDAASLPGSLHPLSSLGLESLLPRAIEDSESIPLIKDRIILGGQFVGRLSVHEGLCADATRFLDFLIAEQEKEFGQFDQFVIDSKLAKAQMLLFGRRHLECHNILNGLLATNQLKYRFATRRLVCRILMAKCEYVRTGVFPIDQFAKLGRQFRSTPMSKTLRQELPRIFPEID